MHIPSPIAKIAAILVLLAWPMSAWAAPPPGATGVTAAMENGNVRVRWDPVRGQDIARYRIYYSHESILQNDGAYDDFDSTPGDTTEFLLTNLPPLTRIYVAVLAVNAAGEESASFGNEAMLDLPSTAADQTPPAPLTSTQQPASSLHLVSAQALSPTTVSLTFSEPVTVRQEEAVGAFQLTDATGAATAIRQIAVLGPNVTLDTVALQANMPYTVKALLVRAAQSPNGFAVIVDSNANAASFTYSGSSPTSQPSPAQATDPLSAPTNMRMRIERMEGMHADVLLTFAMPEGAVVPASFEVFQSINGGKSYATPQTITGTARSVRFTNVPLGAFAVLLRAIAADGRASPTAPAAITIQTSGTSSPSRSTPLEKTGAGVGAVLVLSGAVVGWRKMRTKVAGNNR